MRIYLETSVISGSLDKREGRFHEFSNRLLKVVRLGVHKGYISTLVMEEVSRAPLKKRIELERKISRLNLHLLEVREEVFDLANEYVESKLIPEKYRADAIHIATAVANSLDVLVSWNLSHIVRTKTINGVNSVNKSKGYGEIRIMTPEMVIQWLK